MDSLIKYSCNNAPRIRISWLILHGIHHPLQYVFLKHDAVPDT